VPYAFISFLQDPVAKASLIARGPNVDAALAQAIAAIKSADNTLPILQPRRVSDQVNAILMPQRFGATLLTVFALIAAGIATVGVYATLAYVVAQRRLEIGIRMALGAQSRDVMRAVLVKTGFALAGGLIGGLGLSAVIARALGHFLFRIGTFDVPSFVGATALLAAVVGVFAVIPARRATRIDPVIAIRSSVS
jgi:putative ABC transport system permease protein